ncbi:GNAT family N-acetyltransferase [Rhizobium daejeonense]|uniref:GNAT family N-acetyltransferase n=1 Tax=Rhizobium daejeonense TaxID=240521 RepID=A0A6M1RW83_9HYPH|nr:GNAT family N-acetyltransferase [Rhizobium daejeonense]NGO63389.1 GNAT family N-acetyltransferase [Rhizobium daejeonense]
MAGYFGTETQQRLQARAEENAAFISATPGACQAGRMMSCDDPDLLGWPQIDAFLARDGVCGFRLIPAETVDDLKARLAERDYRLDTWDVFLGTREAALAASEAILARGLPEGLDDLAGPDDPEGADTVRIQSLMAGAGVVPFSGSLLTGAAGPALTVVIGKRGDKGDGDIVATAHGYLPHNAHSPFHRYAWGGLVAVAESERGKGLGKHVNARMVRGVFRDLGATHVYELVSATNTTSRRMVEACGLNIESGLVCGIATPSGGAHFTR